MARVIEIDLTDTHPARIQHVLDEAFASPARLKKITIQETEEEKDGIYVILMGGYGKDYLGAGIRNLLKVETVGSIGDYGFANTENSECIVQGNAGDYFGHSQHSGTLTIMGSAGRAVASMGQGGFLVVLGDAADEAGCSLRGADVLVRGDVGKRAGYRMRGGNLVIGGNAGTDLGHQLIGGTIYLRGDAESISAEIEECRLREPDRLKLGLLLMKAGIKASAIKEFRVYRSVNDL